MTQDQWIEISSWGMLLWAVSTTVVLLIQLFIWPDDRQKWSAAIAVAALGVILWRLWLSYRFNVLLGGTEQGIFFFVFGAVAWAGLAYESWRVNKGSYRARWREITRREGVMTLREGAVNDREVTATSREGNVAGREGAVTAREVAATERETHGNTT